MIKPLFDKVVLKMIETEKITESGIILTEETKEKSQTAIVVAVGSGGFIDGKTIPMQVAVNDKVFINQDTGTEIKYENQEYIIVSQTDILGIIL